jgi:hypothetical protein
VDVSGPQLVQVSELRVGQQLGIRLHRSDWAAYWANSVVLEAQFFGACSPTVRSKLEAAASNSADPLWRVAARDSRVCSGPQRLIVVAPKHEHSRSRNRMQVHENDIRTARIGDWRIFATVAFGNFRYGVCVEKSSPVVPSAPRAITEGKGVW